jgi:hypothetical protein
MATCTGRCGAGALAFGGLSPLEESRGPWRTWQMYLRHVAPSEPRWIAARTLEPAYLIDDLSDDALRVAVETRAWPAGSHIVKPSVLLSPMMPSSCVSSIHGVRGIRHTSSE